MTDVAVVGASGYAARELFRILAGHPAARLVMATSTQESSPRVDALHPSLASRVNLQLAADLFNVFNEQTGYNFEPRRSFAAFGTPRNYYDPRRLQVAARLQF